jgi:hypothetical protein
MRNSVSALSVLLVYILGFIIGLCVIRFFKQKGK